jgi:hypothetical protein
MAFAAALPGSSCGGRRRSMWKEKLDDAPFEQSIFLARRTNDFGDADKLNTVFRHATVLC